MESEGMKRGSATNLCTARTANRDIPSDGTNHVRYSLNFGIFRVLVPHHVQWVATEREILEP